MKSNPILLFGTLLGLAVSATAANGKWDLFLCFGQSNMAGPGTAEAQDKTTNPRIKVLAFNNCTGKTFDQWYTATPPLHNCYEGLGPADYFSKTLLDTSDMLGLGIDTIGLIPCAYSGVDISFFSKGVRSSRRGDFKIVPQDTGISAYLWMLGRVRLAMRKGNLRGIIFHQGEADWTDTARKAWPGRVTAILNDLKADLGITTDIPFVAGELRPKLGRTTNESCCFAHNTYVAQLVNSLPMAGLASSSGLTGVSDAYHFDSPSIRTFGHRYAAAMVPLLRRTSSIAGMGATTVPGLRIDRTAQGTVIHADAPLDRATLVSAQGKSFELGSGEQLTIAAGRFQAGVHFLRAVAGSSIETRTILIE